MWSFFALKCPGKQLVTDKCFATFSASMWQNNWTGVILNDKKETFDVLNGSCLFLGVGVSQRWLEDLKICFCKDFNCGLQQVNVTHHSSFCFKHMRWIVANISWPSRRPDSKSFDSQHGDCDGFADFSTIFWNRCKWKVTPSCLGWISGGNVQALVMMQMSVFFLNQWCDWVTHFFLSWLTNCQSCALRKQTCFDVVLWGLTGEHLPLALVH